MKLNTNFFIMYYDDLRDFSAKVTGGNFSENTLYEKLKELFNVENPWKHVIP
jgi:hypothetical protein